VSVGAPAAYLAKKRVLEEDGRVGNQENLKESFRQAQDKLPGFFCGVGVVSFVSKGWRPGSGMIDVHAGRVRSLVNWPSSAEGQDKCRPSVSHRHFLRVRLIPLRTMVSRFGSVVMAFIYLGSAILVLMLCAMTRPPGRTKGKSLLR